MVCIQFIVNAFSKWNQTNHIGCEMPTHRVWKGAELARQITHKPTRSEETLEERGEQMKYRCITEDKRGTLQRRNTSKFSPTMGPTAREYSDICESWNRTRESRAEQSHIPWTLTVIVSIACIAHFSLRSFYLLGFLPHTVNTIIEIHTHHLLDCIVQWFPLK